MSKLPADQAQRQGRITLSAWDALGREAALQFLNSHDDALDGRPLDVATASADGFEAIQLAITARTPMTPSA
ncbi:hypothetical protein [Sphingobium sp. YR768]|uniref:hypothetical protein n=1 Tax=Sphingobium sp. YR768 TaxID=1884365 RepID=UPI000B84EDF9|nr:hypothetical protein [Sphingobium sp. YR768]